MGLRRCFTGLNPHLSLPASPHFSILHLQNCSSGYFWLLHTTVYQYNCLKSNPITSRQMYHVSSFISLPISSYSKQYNSLCQYLKSSIITPLGRSVNLIAVLCKIDKSYMYVSVHTAECCTVFKHYVQITTIPMYPDISRCGSLVTEIIV